MSAVDQSRDQLDVVEDELLAILKDAEKMTTALRDLPEKEDDAREAATTILDRLAKVNDGLLNNIELLADYIPYERSATQSRLKARQAKTDLEAANFSLWMVKSDLDERLPEEEDSISNFAGGGPRGPTRRDSGPDSAKRMRHG